MAQPSGEPFSSSPSDGTIFTDRVLLALCVVGLCLRLIQWIWAPSQWLDEIAVSRNLLDRSTWQLMTGPLAYDQVAPKGFLLASRAAIAMFGSSDYVLRACPLVGALGAMVGFTYLASSVLRRRECRLAVAGFAVAAPLICYGATVKQYSTDVLIAVLAFTALLRVDRRLRSGLRPTVVDFIVGALAPWFSQTALFVVGAGGASLAAWHWLDGSPARQLRRLLPLLGVWALSSVASLLDARSSMSADTAQYMQVFWKDGFPPQGWRLVIAQAWPWNRLVEIFSDTAMFGLGYPFGQVYAGLALLGLVFLVRTSPRRATLLVAPLVVSVLAAVARQYPFQDRVLLFLMPVWFVGLGHAFGVIGRWISSKTAVQVLASGALAMPTVLPVVMTPPPYQFEDVKPVMAAIQAKASPADRYFVHYGGAVAFNYYAPSFGIAGSAVVVPPCKRGDTPSYYREIDRLRGEPRVWVFLTHVLPRTKEHDDILAYFDAIGLRRDALVRRPRRVQNDAARQTFTVEAYLYDLSDRAKGREITADGFPVTGPRTPLPDSPCGRGPNAILNTTS